MLSGAICGYMQAVILPGCNAPGIKLISDKGRGCVMKSRYFRTDIRRMLKSYGIYAAILGVAVSMFFSLENVGLINGNVLFTFRFATSMSGMRVAYVFCALAYAASFCDDLEYKYVRYQTIRGSLKAYVASKVCVIFLSSVVVLVLGSLLFVLLCRIQGPWVGPDMGGIGGTYEGLIESGHYIWYCAFYALQLGLLGGILSVLAALFSLYITNKGMVFVLPVLIYQILGEAAGSGKFSVYAFCAYNSLFDKDWQNLLCLVLVSAGFISVMACGIYRKLRTRM